MVKQIEIEELDRKVQEFLREIETEEGASIMDKGVPRFQIVAEKAKREAAKNEVKEILEKIWERTRESNLTEKEVDELVAEALWETCGRRL